MRSRWWGTSPPTRASESIRSIGGGKRCCMEFVTSPHGKIAMWTPRILEQGSTMCSREFYNFSTVALACCGDLVETEHLTTGRQLTTRPKQPLVPGLCQNHHGISRDWPRNHRCKTVLAPWVLSTSRTRGRTQAAQELHVTPSLFLHRRLSSSPHL